jgi:hypothetical protein
MQLEILNTTDGRHIGVIIESTARPLVLSDDEDFHPDLVREISSGVWRLSNPNYVVDAREI